MKKTLTDRLLRSLKPAPAGQRVDLMDTVVPGFGVRTTDKVKTFILIARYPGSPNPTRRKIASVGEVSLEAARARARNWLELIRRGIDPAEDEKSRQLAEQRKRKNTFVAVAEDFIKDKLSEERRGREVEQDIRRELIPAWGGRPISSIEPLDVRAVIRTIKDRGTPYQAHNLLTTVRRLFGWAIDQHCYGLETSPCDRLKPRSLIGERKPRQRILTPVELRALWQATETMGYPYGPLLRLLALTGARLREIAQARWSEVDLERKLLVIPAERMKADAAHVIPLSAAAAEILAMLPRFKGGGYLFTTTAGAKPINAFSKAKKVLDQEMAKALGAPVEPGIVVHDLRRTARSNFSAIPGVSHVVAELTIGHTQSQLHRTYDLYAYIDERRFALDAWAARLLSFMNPPAGDNVVSLHRAG